MSAVHSKLVGSLQLKQKFSGRWMELVNARVVKLLQWHGADDDVFYLLLQKQKSRTQSDFSQELVKPDF